MLKWQVLILPALTTVSDVIVLSAAVHEIVLFIIVVNVVVGTTNVGEIGVVLRGAGDYVGWVGSKVKK